MKNKKCRWPECLARSRLRQFRVLPYVIEITTAKALQPQLTRARTDKAKALSFYPSIKQIKKPQFVAFLFADGHSAEQNN